MSELKHKLKESRKREQDQIRQINLLRNQLAFEKEETVRKLQEKDVVVADLEAVVSMTNKLVSLEASSEGTGALVKAEEAKKQAELEVRQARTEVKHAKEMLEKIEEEVVVKVETRED